MRGLIGTFTIFNGELRYIWIWKLSIMIWRERSILTWPVTKIEVFWDNE